MVHLPSIAPANSTPALMRPDHPLGPDSVVGSDAWEQVVAVNTDGTFLMSHATVAPPCGRKR